MAEAASSKTSDWTRSEAKNPDESVPSSWSALGMIPRLDSVTSAPVSESLVTSAPVRALTSFSGQAVVDDVVVRNGVVGHIGCLHLGAGAEVIGLHGVGPVQGDGGAASEARKTASVAITLA